MFRFQIHAAKQRLPECTQVIEALFIHAGTSLYILLHSFQFIANESLSHSIVYDIFIGDVCWCEVKFFTVASLSDNLITTIAGTSWWSETTNPRRESRIWLALRRTTSTSTATRRRSDPGCRGKPTGSFKIDWPTTGSSAPPRRSEATPTSRWRTCGPKGSSPARQTATRSWAKRWASPPCRKARARPSWSKVFHRQPCNTRHLCTFFRHYLFLWTRAQRGKISSWRCWKMIVTMFICVLTCTRCFWTGERYCKDEFETEEESIFSRAYTCTDLFPCCFQVSQFVYVDIKKHLVRGESESHRKRLNFN